LRFGVASSFSWYKGRASFRQLTAFSLQFSFAVNRAIQIPNIMKSQSQSVPRNLSTIEAMPIELDNAEALAIAAYDPRVFRVCDKDIKTSGRILRIGRLEGEGYEFWEGDPERLLDGLRQSSSRVDVFTFTQRLPETLPRHQYKMEWDNFAAVEVTTFEHWWTHQIGFKARNKAKQATKKGVVLRVVPFNEELVRGIWEIYNEHPVRQGRRFYHYGKTLKTVYREESTHLDRSVFVGAFFHDELIGFIKLVADETNTQAGLMNILSMIRHRDKAPTNALIAEAVKLCAERNIRYLVYSRFSYDGKERSSVSDFKERNGMRRIEIPRYYVPLTVIGRLALQLGLHRPIKSRVPEALLVGMRELRAKWYDRNVSSTKSSQLPTPE
jgi:hypothetical protein